MGYDRRSMLIRVGQSPSVFSVPRYAKYFDLYELRLDSGRPKRKRLELMKSQAPQDFAFAVVVPRVVSALEVEPTPEALAPVLTAAQLLGARWLVVRTPPSARPAPRTRTRLAQLIELLKPSGLAIAWEPGGLLAEADAERAAEALGVVLSRDPSRDDLPPGPAAYGRVQSLGAAGRVRGSAIERAAERLAGFAEAFVILEGDNAARAARDLKSLLAGASDVFADDDDDGRAVQLAQNGAGHEDVDAEGEEDSDDLDGEEIDGDESDDFDDEDFDDDDEPEDEEKLS